VPVLGTVVHPAARYWVIATRFVGELVGIGIRPRRMWRVTAAVAATMLVVAGCQDSSSLDTEELTDPRSCAWDI
jgi:hypothetical protein